MDTDSDETTNSQNAIEKSIDDLAKQRHRHQRSQLNRPWIYYWPPFIAIVPACIMQVMWGDSPRVIATTHGYFSVLGFIGYLGSIVYALKLRGCRRHLKYAIPMYLNLFLLLSPVIIIAFTFLFGHDS